MWETLVGPPRGRLSARKFIVLVITLLMVCFSYSAVMSPVAHAADASWKDGALTYGGRTYSASAVADPTVINIPEGVTYYTSIDTEASPQKAYVIYFANGTSPPDAKQATYVTFDYANGRYTNKSSLTTISITPQATAQQNAGTKSCAVDEVGWIICPLTNFLANAMDYIYGAVSAFLEVRPLATTSNQAMYRAWDYMRNVANIVFFIAFMFVIYSQVSGFGMSNYGIKRVLPRVFIAAILVNTSYWICAVAIDVFNILGYSIQDVFESVRNSLVGTESNSVISWKSMATFVLSGGTAAVGGGIAAYLGITTATTAMAGAAAMGSTAIIALLYLLLPLLLSVLFVVLMTFLILAARQAIITIFVVLAPLAFVAYLLPNTEEWFTKWRKALFTLLLVFPAFSLVFGGAQLAAAIIIQNATDLNMVLLAMGVQVAPLAITPLLLKLGGGILNRFAGIVNNPAKGMLDRGKNWAKDRSGEQQAAGARALAERADKLGFVNGRPKGSKWYKPSRYNPMNAAYNRDYTRRRREGMKAANEAMSDSYFSGTTAGTEIDHTKKDAGAIQHAYGAVNTESWNRRTYGNPATGTGPNRIGQLHHTGHMAENRAKIIEEAATNRANRDFQTDLNTGTSASVAGLRNLKIQGDVDTNVADLHASNITADSKLRFQQEVDGSRALRKMKVGTYIAEQQASSIENRLDSNAKARWQQLGVSDANVQNLRLRETQAADAAKLTEARFDNLVADVKTKGNDAHGYLQVNGNVGNVIQRVSRETHAANDRLEASKAEEAAIIQEWRTEEGAKDLTGKNASIAKALMEADVQKRAQNQRTNIATSQANNEYAGKVKGDEIIPGGTESIAVVAGGIGDRAGISQAKAKAVQTTFATFDENVSAERTLVSRNEESEILGATFTDSTGKEVIGLANDAILNEPEERLTALVSTIAKRYHQESHIKVWGRLGELRNKADELLASAVTDEDKKTAENAISAVKSAEQQLMSDKTKIPFGIGAGAQGLATVGDFKGDVYKMTRARIMTDISVKSLAEMDPDDMRLIFELARAGKLSPEQSKKIADTYKDWQEDANYKQLLKDKHRRFLDPIFNDSQLNDQSGYTPADDADLAENKFDVSHLD